MLDGAVNLDDRAGRAELNLGIANGWVGDPIVPSVDAIEVAVRATTELADLRPRKLTAAVSDTSFSVGETSVSGLAAAIALDDPLVPRVGELQRVTIKSVQSGDALLTGGSATLAFDGWSTIVLAETTWNWLDGKVAARNVRFTGLDDPIDATLTVERIDMSRLPHGVSSMPGRAYL